MAQFTWSGCVTLGRVFDCPVLKSVIDGYMAGATTTHNCLRIATLFPTSGSCWCFLQLNIGSPWQSLAGIWARALLQLRIHSFQVNSQVRGSGIFGDAPGSVARQELCFGAPTSSGVLCTTAASGRESRSQWCVQETLVLVLVTSCSFFRFLFLFLLLNRERGKGPESDWKERKKILNARRTLANFGGEEDLEAREAGERGREQPVRQDDVGER